jgi:hypothetical protein
MNVRYIPLSVILSVCFLSAGCVLRGDPITQSKSESMILVPTGIIQTQPFPIVTPKITKKEAHNFAAKSSQLITTTVPTLAQMRIITFSPEQIATQMQPYVDKVATEVQGFKENADISLESNGQTYTFTWSSRFFVFLDDDKYPVQQLKCEPESVIGYISNGSFRGPDRYPIYFEATRVGECVLKNRDFNVKIIVVQRTPSLTRRTPLPTYAPSYP